MALIPISYLIIGATALISFWAFSNNELFIKFAHYPYEEKREKEYFRLLTHGFLHSKEMQLHLFFNMWVLYIFGPTVEKGFDLYLPFGKLFFLFFYLISIVVASIPTYFKHQDNPRYRSIGASGAVSAVLFAYILFVPMNELFLMFIPIPIKGYIFGALYLGYSFWASNNSRDNIDHIAHYAGAIFGFFFPLFFRPELLFAFFNKVTGHLTSLF